MKRIVFLAGLLLSSLLAQAEAGDPRVEAVVQGALDQLGKTVSYDPAYVKLVYPGGDLPIERGVCSDVVIRAFRQAGVDLQVLVHEDMRRAFAQYPRLWGLKSTDRNIDHRRVPNLRTFFQRQGKNLPLDQRDYRPGDLLTWILPGNLPHIGIVSNLRSAASGRPLIVHNIGAGAQLEDMLERFELTGHYRFFP
jgi:uncharacterized protein YijF (DUF1287 family)